MGRDKASLPHPLGLTYLAHAVERLKSVCDEVVISAAAPLDDHQTIVDAFPGGGPAVGIATALQHAAAQGFDACVFTPVDTPALQRDDLLTLINHWQTHRGAVLAWSDRLEPLIGVYATKLTNEIQALAQSNRRSLSGHFQAESPPTHQAVSLPIDHCHNVNRPEDLDPGSNCRQDLDVITIVTRQAQPNDRDG